MSGSAAYDVVCVGGGLGGAALARGLAQAGASVLVLERTRAFSDRVRGEVLVPWGCVEAQRLGLLDLLRDGCGHDLTSWAISVGGTEVMRRAIADGNETGLPVVTWFHPDMQDIVLRAAQQAGAEVRRGASVTQVLPGRPPRVRFRTAGADVEREARLVVGADGRGSSMRGWGGFEVASDPQRRFFAGVLLEGMSAPEDTMHSRFAPDRGLMSWVFPQGGGRVRAYVGYHAASDFERLSGERDRERFIETSIDLGVPREEFEGARISGPLATFDGTDNWVEHPYRDGVALVGDAAATSDPTWGQGMSLALRDVRVLLGRLAASDDWDAAGHAYAEEHQRTYAACHRCDNWYTDLLLEIGPEAESLRARCFPRLLEDRTRLPLTPLVGPELAPADEEMRRRFFAEDA